MKLTAFFLVLLATCALSLARPSRHHKGKAFNLTKSGGKRGVGEIWSNCTSSTDMSTITGITFSPDPPQKGKSITVTANFILKENITSGSVDADLKYDGIFPIKKTLDLCTMAKDAGMSCPLLTTTTSVTIKNTVPNVGGHITGQVTATDQNGKRIGCVNIDFSL